MGQGEAEGDVRVRGVERRAHLVEFGRSVCLGDREGRGDAARPALAGATMKGCEGKVLISRSYQR